MKSEHIYELRLGTGLHSVPQSDVISIEIQSLRNLPDGWHFGEGIGATKVAVETALRINEIFWGLNARNREVFPNIAGGIQVNAYHGDDDIEVLCYHDGHLDLMHVSGEDVIFDKENIALEEISRYLGGLPWTSPKSFESFIQGISASNDYDLTVQHSIIPPMEGYRSSIHSVLDNTVKPSALTFRVRQMYASPEITLRFFLGSNERNSPLALVWYTSNQQGARTLAI